MMDELKGIAFHAKCRLCLERVGVSDLFENPHLLQNVFLCTGVTIINLDSLPRKICLNCCDVVQSAIKLRELATANETLLKSLFDSDEQNENVSEILGVTVKPIEDNPISNKTESCPENTHKSKKRKKLEVDGNSNKEKYSSGNENIIEPNTRPSQSSDNALEAQDLKISVRKDLFDCSTNVSSSTKDTIEEKYSQKLKRIKAEKAEAGDYECEVCLKTFTVWKKFYVHQRWHNKNILCPLDMCGKKFSTKGDLEKHIRTHTGERPYQCEICKRGFTQRGTLKVHRDTVHAVEEYIL